MCSGQFLPQPCLLSSRRCSESALYCHQALTILKYSFESSCYKGLRDHVWQYQCEEALKNSIADHYA